MGCLSRDIVRSAMTLFVNLIVTVIKCNSTKVSSKHTKSILILIVHPGWDLLVYLKILVAAVGIRNHSPCEG